MNTLSSLLAFLGNTLGANPNTLTTTSKTIVGAINEVDADASTLMARAYIEDKGTYTHTDGGAHVTWEYRKWSDGTAECWGEWGSASFAPNTTIGSFFGRVLGAYNFPPQLFIEPPHGFFNLHGWGNGYYFGQFRRPTKDEFYLEVFNSVNASAEGIGSLYAIGKWK